MRNGTLASSRERWEGSCGLTSLSAGQRRPPCPEGRRRPNGFAFARRQLPSLVLEVAAAHAAHSTHTATGTARAAGGGWG